MNMKKTILAGLTALIIGTVGVASDANATLYTISDDNSIAKIDNASQSGMYDWNVDGTDHLFQQWFWYRVGSSAPEASIDTLTFVAGGTTDTNFDGNAETLYLKYSSAGLFQLEVTYILTGGSVGSNTSDIGESIKIKNLSNSPLDFHFFQYTDLDLGGDASDDTAVHNNANTITQKDSGTVMGESAVTGPPAHWEIAAFPSIRTKLNDGVATTLADNTTPFGPADVTWAFEWDVNINPAGQQGDTYLISKDKKISHVPEPATILLMGAGLLGLGIFGRKRIKA